MKTSRRELLRSGSWMALATVLASLPAHGDVLTIAESQTETNSNSIIANGLTVMSNETPFFEHYHQLHVPFQTLIQPPEQGLLLKSSRVDAGSYDVQGFRRFVESSGLNSKALSQHDHDVKITAEQLKRIVAGEKDVEIRVISKNGNYVHNFLITAPPAVLATIRNATRR